MLRTSFVMIKTALTGCDCFHLALDTMMRRSGQGPHQAQAVLELDGSLDLARFEAALNRLAATYPILCARLKRSVAGIPYWAVDPRVRQRIQLRVWDPHAADLSGRTEVRDLLQERLNDPLDPWRGINLSFDVARTAHGVVVAATWTHMLLDAAGAELLLTELANIEADACARRDPQSSSTGVARRSGYRTSWQQLQRARQWLGPLTEIRFRSLCGGRESRPGRARYQVVALDPDETARTLERARRLSGSLFMMPFFLAAVTQAHDLVFASLILEPGDYVISLPVQMRPRGSAGPIFQNHVSILFFHLTRADISTMEGTVAAIRRQFETMVRDRLDECFATALNLARRVPPGVYLAAIRRQFGGEISSFFHSYTGLFAPKMPQTFYGATIRNAYHAPAVSSPPGTGVFVSEWRGRLNMTVSWREGVVTPAELRVLETTLLEQFYKEH